MNAPLELQRYLHEHIPLSHAMQVAVIMIESDSIVLGAPLAPNINHRETVFGGSASALAILAAWSLLHTRLTAHAVPARLVIQRNTMEYERAILSEFTARSFLPEPDHWHRFLNTLARRGKGRIQICSTLEAGGEVVGTFTGEFVALTSKNAAA
ncbi:MAG TPA: YiiD C-terminal domain-containing protein [Steroidobacteraceae bacterium]|nr:YiiD C-terminal domain-containing protein [Steroidobacteraceae bacterium]